MENVRQIIKMAGGATHVSDVFGITPQAISDWCVKNRIPGEWSTDIWILLDGRLPYHVICPPKVLSIPESLIFPQPVGDSNTATVERSKVA